MVNALLTDEEQLYEGDLDLCKWSEPSPYGQYATVEPSMAAYGSCTEWKEKLGAWVEAGMPAEPVNLIPGGVGVMQPRFLGRAEIVETLPNNVYRVWVHFLPRNDSRILLRTPSWPSMSTATALRVREMMDQILVHEKGHQNLAGWVSGTFQETVEVEAASRSEAVDKALAQTGGAEFDLYRTRSSNAVNDRLYEAKTNHGSTQSSLGGNDLVPVECKGPKLLSYSLSSSSTARHICEDFGNHQGSRWVSENADYSTEPAGYGRYIRTSTLRCPGIDPVQTEDDVPGEPPGDGERAEVSSDFTGTGTSTGVSQSSSTAGSASFRYFNKPTPERNSELAMNGAQSCTATYTHQGGRSGGDMHAKTHVKAAFDFEVFDNSSIKISATGAGTLRKVRPDSWTEYVAADAEYNKVLDPGIYNLEMRTDCAAYVKRDETTHSSRAMQFTFDVVN